MAFTGCKFDYLSKDACIDKKKITPLESKSTFVATLQEHIIEIQPATFW